MAWIPNYIISGHQTGYDRDVTFLSTGRVVERLQQSKSEIQMAYPQRMYQTSHFHSDLNPRPTLVGSDILSEIAQYAVWNMSKRDVFILKDSSKALYRIFLPYLYRQINFISIDQANNCLQTLSLYPNLRYRVQTLAISIDFAEGGTGRGKRRFWALLQRVLPELGNLKCFNIFYYHEDTDALFRWVSRGIPSILPGSLQKVSFIPIDDNHDMSLDEVSEASLVYVIQ